MSNVIHRSLEGPPIEMNKASLLVTGGTGSFGRALVRRLLETLPPRRLIVFSRDEQKQDSMARELALSFPDKAHCLRFFIGDIRDASRLELAMRDVDFVIHAAALKIVPTAEYAEGRQVILHTGRSIYTVALRQLVEQRSEWSWAAIQIVEKKPK